MISYTRTRIYDEEYERVYSVLTNSLMTIEIVVGMSYNNEVW